LHFFESSPTTLETDDSEADIYSIKDMEFINNRHLIGIHVEAYNELNQSTNGRIFFKNLVFHNNKGY